MPEKSTKESVIEGTQWVVYNNLISIDGPDGSGKSSLSELLVTHLQSVHGDENVVLIRPSRFDASPQATLVGKKLEKITPLPPDNSMDHNAFYLEAMSKNYQYVVLPALLSGRIVILDSSDVRALAFMLDRGSPEAIRHTQEQITKGVLSCRIQPSLRFVIKASPEDLAKNLKTKEGLDKGDPHNITAIIRRINKYCLAIKFFRELTAGLGILWYIVSIQHVVGFTDNYFMSVLKEQFMPIIVSMKGVLEN